MTETNLGKHEEEANLKTTHMTQETNKIKQEANNENKI